MLVCFLSFLSPDVILSKNKRKATLVGIVAFCDCEYLQIFNDIMKRKNHLYTKTFKFLKFMLKYKCFI